MQRLHRPSGPHASSHRHAEIQKLRATGEVKIGRKSVRASTPSETARNLPACEVGFLLFTEDSPAAPGMPSGRLFLPSNTSVRCARPCPEPCVVEESLSALGAGFFSCQRFKNNKNVF